MITTKEAVEHLIKALNSDEAYKRSWVATIAVMFQDEWERESKEGLPCTRVQIHKISNKTADNFINLLCYTRDGKEGE